MLEAAGWTQTDDSGQIDWDMVPTRVSGAPSGYEIYKLNDSLADTCPIFLKLEFGTSSYNNSVPQIWFTIGRGSDGSGTILGVVHSRTSLFDKYRSISSTTQSYMSAACAVDGAMWFCWKLTSRESSNNRGFFCLAILRTVDDTGMPTDEGIVVYRDSGDANTSLSANCMSINLHNGFSRSNPMGNYYGAGYTFNPYMMGSTIYAGDPPTVQVTRHFCVMPHPRPLEHILSTPDTTLIPLGATFDAEVLSGERTFICVGNAFSAYDYICLIWE